MVVGFFVFEIAHPTVLHPNSLSIIDCANSVRTLDKHNYTYPTDSSTEIFAIIKKYFHKDTQSLPSIVDYVVYLLYNRPYSQQWRVDNEETGKNSENQRTYPCCSP